MKRREFIAGLAGGGVARGGAGQQKALPLVGILSSGAEQLRPDQFDGLRRGLEEAGFVLGTNVSVIARGADDNYDSIPALASDLVRQNVALIARPVGRSQRSRPRRRLRRSQLYSRPFPIPLRAA